MSEGSLLEALLQPGALRISFQPIYDLRDGGRSLFALECLTRGPHGTNAHRAEVLFEYVRRKHEEIAIDRACVAAAFAEAKRLPQVPRFSFNVHASTLGRDEGFAPFVAREAERQRIDPHRLVMEIVEHAPTWGSPRFVTALRELRHVGVAVALDDVGLGHSNYRMMIDVRPEILKVDRYLITGCHADQHRQAILESLALLAARTGARAVAEGVEEQRDLETVIAAGFDLVQGYLFCAPLASSELAAAGVLPPPPGP